MREQILNFFEKTDELFFKKVPYQIYLFGAFVSLLIVAGSIYEYTHPDPNVQNLIGLKEMQDELFNNGGELMEKEVYQGPVPLNSDLEYFRETGITKPLEVNN